MIQSNFLILRRNYLDVGLKYLIYSIKLSRQIYPLNEKAGYKSKIKEAINSWQTKYSVYYVIDRTSFYKSAFDMYIRKECLTHNETKNDRRSTLGRRDY